MKLNILKRVKNKLTRTLNERRTKKFLKKFKKAGTGIFIKQPVCFEGMEYMELGNDISIAAFVHMWGYGGIKIGNRVMIASHTAISSLTHDYSKKIMYNTTIAKPVIIKDDVWIGAHSVIMPGVILNKGCVVGAGSVVTKDVPENTIVTGIPAKILKIRQIKE